MVGKEILLTFGISLDFIFEISPYIFSLLKFSEYAFIACFFSDVNTHCVFNPILLKALSNPILIPPRPANKSINFTVFVFLYSEIAKFNKWEHLLENVPLSIILFILFNFLFFQNFFFYHPTFFLPLFLLNYTIIKLKNKKFYCGFAEKSIFFIADLWYNDIN